MDSNKDKEYKELLMSLNLVFKGHFTKVVNEDTDAYYVFDSIKKEVCRFDKKYL